ncbi:16358_t:CDS:2 [Dentiscutata heterogama]|uniref:16358_t:CDS:1 n=1 Tax=Dentiscutata heterogama TaxID=1316150 RepID=A0ACA9JZG4_9GLOM|nr:16358_t:CDS:2 [Dentiscutata heterogama]
MKKIYFAERDDEKENNMIKLFNLGPPDDEEEGNDARVINQNLTDSENEENDMSEEEEEENYAPADSEEEDISESEEEEEKNTIKEKLPDVTYAHPKPKKLIRGRTQPIKLFPLRFEEERRIHSKVTYTISTQTNLIGRDLEQIQVLLEEKETEAKQLEKLLQMKSKELEKLQQKLEVLSKYEKKLNILEKEAELKKKKEIQEKLETFLDAQAEIIRLNYLNATTNFATGQKAKANSYLLNKGRFDQLRKLEEKQQEITKLEIQLDNLEKLDEELTKPEKEKSKLFEINLSNQTKDEDIEIPDLNKNKEKKIGISLGASVFGNTGNLGITYESKTSQPTEQNNSLPQTAQTQQTEPNNYLPQQTEPNSFLPLKQQTVQNKQSPITIIINTSGKSQK